jgi:hypothetical protein
MPDRLRAFRKRFQRSVQDFVIDVIKPPPARESGPACPKCLERLGVPFQFDEYSYYRCKCGSASVWTLDGRPVAGEMDIVVSDD